MTDIWWLITLLLLLIVCIGIFSYLTNPFIRFTLVKDLNSEVSLVRTMLVMTSGKKHRVRHGKWADLLAKLKSGWHIIANTYKQDNRSTSTTVAKIIEEIHALRFNPRYPFIISGDHFSVFYPRSLGIFYHALLDPRIQSSEQDWLDRQKLYLKSTAFAIEVFSQAKSLSTTIVPIGRTSVALMNIYAPPSDTLYSLLFALQSLFSSSAIQERYPYTVKAATTKSRSLQTTAAAKELLATYSQELRRHWLDFQSLVYDETTGLVKKNILLSGVKDMSKRESAFYDNVMFWKTWELAQSLKIIPANKAALVALKQRILREFWDETAGHFLEDLSDKSINNSIYSSEWIIAYQTGFLDPRNSADLSYLVKSVRYIQRQQLDQPFGLHYHTDERPAQLYWPVRLFAPSYGSTTIWSNLGQEYTKLLIHLYQVTGKKPYLHQAKRQLDAYAANIERDRGYPELYDKEGAFFRQGLYKSIRQTGWVISFEQARAMYQATR